MRFPLRRDLADSETERRRTVPTPSFDIKRAWVFKALVCHGKIAAVFYVLAKDEKGKGIASVGKLFAKKAPAELLSVAKLVFDAVAFLCGPDCLHGAVGTVKRPVKGVSLGAFDVDPLVKEMIERDFQSLGIFLRRNIAFFGDYGISHIVAVDVTVLFKGRNGSADRIFFLSEGS